MSYHNARKNQFTYGNALRPDEPRPLSPIPESLSSRPSSRRAVSHSHISVRNPSGSSISSDSSSTSEDFNSDCGDWSIDTTIAVSDQCIPPEIQKLYDIQAARAAQAIKWFTADSEPETKTQGKKERFLEFLKSATKSRPDMRYRYSYDVPAPEQADVPIIISIPIPKDSPSKLKKIYAPEGGKWEWHQ